MLLYQNCNFILGITSRLYCVVPATKGFVLIQILHGFISWKNNYLFYSFQIDSVTADEVMLGNLYPSLTRIYTLFLFWLLFFAWLLQLMYFWLGSPIYSLPFRDIMASVINRMSCDKPENLFKNKKLVINNQKLVINDFTPKINFW